MNRSTLVVPFNDIDAMDDVIERHHQDIAAVILEPVLFNSGVILPHQDYLQSIREITNDRGVLLIFDEVISGFRMAPGGAQEYYGVTPDLSVFGKAIANGFPLSAVTGKKEMMEIVLPQAGRVGFGGTFNAHHISIAAAAACLKEYSIGHVQNHLARLTEKLVNGLREIADRLGIQLKAQGIAGQFSITFTDKPVSGFRQLYLSDGRIGKEFMKFTSEMFNRGIYLNPRHMYHHGISFSHQENDIDLFLQYSEDSLRKNQ